MDNIEIEQAEFENTDVPNSKSNLYCFQFSYLYGDEIYLPYSIGILWAYARAIPKINNNIENKSFVILRENPNDIVSRLEEPKIAAFSTYVWNWEMSVSVARIIKERYPKCLVIFGGPQVPNADRLGDFFEKYPFIDITVHGEGEITFSEILLEYVNDQKFQTIPGLSYRGFTTELRPRTRDLNIFPSPYLTGVFDELFALPYQYHAVWETNRGCPYGCTFCDWGSLIAQKIFIFDEERLIKEMEYFAHKKIAHVYMGDANFGILDRDVGIASRIALINKNSGGFPKKVRVNYTKNSTNRVFQIANILNKQKLDKGITLSVQSMDPETLLTIKRSNLKYETLSAFIKRYQKEGIDTYTEVILGLPGETYKSFRDGIEALLEASAHDSLWIYRCSVLPNAPMNDLDYKTKHKIKTIKSPADLHHIEPGKDPVQEYEDIVVETATMQTKDYVRCQLLAWATQTFHALGLLRVLAIFTNQLNGIQYTTFYERLLEYAEQNPNTVLGKEYLKTKEKINQAITKGKSWFNIVPEFNNQTWSLEEASYLRIMLQLQAFFAEQDGFFNYLSKTEGFVFEQKILTDFLKYQKAIIVKYENGKTEEFQTGCAINSFHRNMMIGKKEKLQYGNYHITITDSYNFNGDKNRYSTEILFWGRRGGKTFYQMCKETPIEQEHTDQLKPAPK